MAESPVTRTLIRQGLHFYDAATQREVLLPEHTPMQLTLAAGLLQEVQEGSRFYYEPQHCKTRAQLEDELQAGYQQTPPLAFRHLLPAGAQLQYSSGPYAFLIELGEDLFLQGFDPKTGREGWLTFTKCKAWPVGSAYPIVKVTYAARLYWLVWNLKHFYYLQDSELPMREMLADVRLPNGEPLFTLVDKAVAGVKGRLYP